MTDTIFALSSGAPPAAIAVIRISGPAAGAALRLLADTLPEPRRAQPMTLRDEDGDVLDHAMVLWLPGPGTVTGEDVAEIHCHGGRAVIEAIGDTLIDVPGLREANPGEFTRRAFANGKIDLAEAEGLADLLEAETELQRRVAMTMATGQVSRRVEAWRERLLGLSATVEAALDFADEDDVTTVPAGFAVQVAQLQEEIAAWLSRPRAEALREGFRVVIAGPPNVGKSTLFNALVEDDAAIATPIAGTTRDVLTRPIAIAGVPFLFADTAGLHDVTEDEIEAIGIERALDALDRADLVLWLGPEGQGPTGAWEVSSQIDRPDALRKSAARHRVSAFTEEGLDALREDLVEAARKALPQPGDAALSERQHKLLLEAARALGSARHEGDPLIVAECLRLARVSFDGLLGRTTTEDMLDSLFGRFCIGK